MEQIHINHIDIKNKSSRMGASMNQLIKTGLKSFLGLGIAFQLCGSPTYAQADGMVNEPGWFMSQDVELVSPQLAEARLEEKMTAKKEAMGEELFAKSFAFKAAAATEITPELQELARGLQHDPLLIYQHVKNHIDYVPYFGYLKGASLTWLDRAGNDFDQAALLIALLRSSGYTANYVYGTMTIPSRNGYNDKDLAHWFGVEENNSLISLVMANGGIPASFTGDSVEMRRVWVEAQIDGNTVQLDPAFKVYDKIDGINIDQAIGYDETALSTAAGGVEGNSSGVPFVRNLSESNIAAKLTEYTTNFVNEIRANYANKSIEEILGDYQIRKETLKKLPSYPSFSFVKDTTWAEVPQQYIHTVNIKHGALDETLNIPEIAGKKLSIDYKATTDVPDSQIPAGGLYYQGQSNTLTFDFVPLTGSGYVTLTGVSRVGSGSDRYDYVSGFNFPRLLYANQRFVAKVRYKADVVGTHAGTFRIHYRQTNGVTGSFDLTATARTIPYPEARLRLDDAIIATEGLAQPGSDFSKMTLTVDHPYSAQGSSFADQSVEYFLKRGGNYIVLSDFGQSRAGKLLEKRQRDLQRLQQTEAEGSRKLLTETLNVLGQSWMRETTMSDQLLYRLANVTSFYHHRFGVIAQEEGFYIDIKAQFIEPTPRTIAASSDDARNAVFRASGFLASALEHGVIEQLQDVKAASTIKLFQLNNKNSNNKLFQVTTSTWNSVKPQLSGYTDAQLDSIREFLYGRSGRELLLPQKGGITLGDWKGYAYIGNTNIGTLGQSMAIGGDYTTSTASLYEPESSDYFTPLLAMNGANRQYFGGFAGGRGDINPITVSQVSSLNTTDSAAILNYDFIDPVDVATGDFLYDLEGLSIGNAEPWGLSVIPSYTTAQNYKKSGLGYGWQHNYDVQLENYTDYDAVLGQRQATDAAAAIISSYITLELMKKSTRTAKDWGLASLTAYWEMEQLRDATYAVTHNQQKLGFVQLPDGRFNPPPGVTLTLKKENDQYVVEGRFGTKLEFDADDRLSTLSDTDGNAVTFAYSNDGLISNVTDASGRQFTFNYNNKRISSVTDSTGRSILFGYDQNDNLTTYTDVAGKRWSFVYDSNHRITRITKPDGVMKVENFYDTLGRVYLQKFSVQGEIAENTVFYTDFRNVEKDAFGNQTVHYLDRYGRRTGIENALGYRSVIEFDGQHRPVKLIDTLGNQVINQYDYDQNLVSITNALNEKARNFYDADHHLIKTEDAEGQVTEHSFDSEHHPVSTSVSPDENKTITTVSAYYPNGFLKSSTDPKGTSTTTTYDVYGNVDTVKVDLRPQVDYDYDELGRLVQFTDQEGATMRFSHNARGQVIESIDPLGKKTQFTYDDLGRNTSVTDREGEVTQFAFTPKDQIERISYHDGTETHFEFDSRDNLVKMTDTLGESVYQYDAINQLVSYQDANDFTLGYSYDGAGNVKTVTYPDGKVVAYSYDVLHRLKTVTNWLNQSEEYSYDAAGRVVQIIRFNGTITDYVYDQASRLIKYIHRKPDGDVINSHDYELDDNGNRVREIRTQPQKATETAGTLTYQYNTAKNRLTSISDGAVTNLSYDDEGQLGAKGNKQYQFNTRHELSAMNRTGDNRVFFYNGSGERLKATKNGVVTYYIYDAKGNLLAEADENKVIQRYYLYGRGLSALVENNQSYTYHYDGVGSTLAITDTDYNIVNQYAYSPYGRDLGRIENIPQPFTYAGRFGIMDEGNDVYYMRARYYDADAGRFISEDPLGLEAGVNLYGYVNANPLLLIDPSGLSAKIPSDNDTQNHPSRFDQINNAYSQVGGAIAEYSYMSPPLLIGTGIGGLAASAGRNASKGLSILKNVLSKAKPTGGHPNQVMSTLDDGTKVLFRKDFGDNAHTLGGKFQGQGKIDHYNIQVQQGKNTIKNLHIVPDGKGGYTVF